MSVDGAIAIPRRVTAASANAMSSVRRTPIVSVIDPTRKMNSVTSVENVAAHQPARLSSIPKSFESHNGNVGKNEKMPRYSKNVAR